MQLITAFQHGDDFFLFFPLAECSLKACFANEDHTRDREFFVWMIGQLFGLAQGIHAIHGNAESGSTSLSPNPTNDEKIGYHHDLKPDNILLCKNGKHSMPPFSKTEQRYGRLQISDFGLGRFREAATGSVSVNVKGTPTYAAPESTTQRSQSRPYDIWSYGCIVIETLVWLLEGPQGLKSFISCR
jgi:serine/threonine protein kinase